VAKVLLVANSSLKLFVYLLLSREFRHTFYTMITCKKGDEDEDWHWREEEEMSREFLSHVKIASVVQAEKNACKTFAE